MQKEPGVRRVALIDPDAINPKPNKNMTLAEFETKVRHACGIYPSIKNLRPFVCRERNPLDCSIFVVGENPATPMATDFWKDYWSSSTGFDYAKWLVGYTTARGGVAGATRRNIDGIVDTVINESSCQILETNLYPFETPSGTSVPTNYKRKDVLKALLRCIAPKVIIAHGKHAVGFLINAPLASEAIVIPAPHLSSAPFGDFPKSLGRAAIRACRSKNCCSCAIRSC
jgi:hypothetical protein